jgi:hypothetical protein
LKPKGTPLLLVGTRKGAFVFTSDDGRRSWKSSGPYFEGVDVFHLKYDHRNRLLLACVNNPFWGPSVERSKDLGGSWKKQRAKPRFPKKSGLSVSKVWHVEPGADDEPNVLYLGVAPACLFKSEDRGATWAPNEALMNHGTRKKWQPGAGGLCLHSVLVEDGDPDHLHVAISAVGTLESEDGGASWEFRNRHVRADFYPNKFPVYGQCVHKIVRHRERPEVIYQQNHCGAYRSDDGGRDWKDISGALPSRFGFPIAVDFNDPKRVYAVPLTGDFNRVPPGGKFGVWVSEDEGRRWAPSYRGFPAPSYYSVLREGLAADEFDPCGVAVGTTTGQLYFSRNQGDSWARVSDALPPILSVSMASA